MELKINSRNLKLTPKIENYIEKKTQRLDRYVPNLTQVTVDLAEQKAKSATQRQVAQITVRDSKGTILRAEEKSNDIFAAVDQSIDKLYRQIKRYRGKTRRHRRDAVEPMLFEEPLPIDETEEQEIGGISRVKRFELEPMTADEAVEHMELLGHNFYVFFNPEEENVNVVYRRDAGDYGLIQPE